jgi:hypothetical protein
MTRPRSVRPSAKSDWQSRVREKATNPAVGSLKGPQFPTLTSPLNFYAPHVLVRRWKIPAPRVRLSGGAGVSRDGDHKSRSGRVFPIVLMHNILRAMTKRMIAVALLWAAIPAVGMRSTIAIPPAVGCHGHGHRAPTHGPATHQCCEAGHDGAMLLKSSEDSRQLLFSCLSISVFEPHLGRQSASRPPVQFVFADKPPSSVPLRV